MKGAQSYLKDTKFGNSGDEIRAKIRENQGEPYIIVVTADEFGGFFPSFVLPMDHRTWFEPITGCLDYDLFRIYLQKLYWVLSTD